MSEETIIYSNIQTKEPDPSTLEIAPDFYIIREIKSKTI